METDEYIAYVEKNMLDYQDVDEAYLENEENRHHFHHYDSGLVTYKKEYKHLYKIEQNETRTQ